MIKINENVSSIPIIGNILGGITQTIVDGFNLFQRIGGLFSGVFNLIKNIGSIFSPFKGIVNWIVKIFTRMWKWIFNSRWL